jgi:hypothetical protein
VTTTLTIDARDAVTVAQALAMGADGYAISATLHFSTTIGPLDVEIRHTGQLSDAGGLFGSND